MLIAAAADLDIRFHRLVGALHDDYERRYPSVGLVCAILRRGTGVCRRGQLATNPHMRRLGVTRATGPFQSYIGMRQALELFTKDDEL